MRCRVFPESLTSESDDAADAESTSRATSLEATRAATSAHRRRAISTKASSDPPCCCASFGSQTPPTRARHAARRPRPAGGSKRGFALETVPAWL